MLCGSGTGLRVANSAFLDKQALIGHLRVGSTYLIPIPGTVLSVGDLSIACFELDLYRNFRT